MIPHRLRIERLTGAPTSTRRQARDLVRSYERHVCKREDMSAVRFDALVRANDRKLTEVALEQDRAVALSVVSFDTRRCDINVALFVDPLLRREHRIRLLTMMLRRAETFATISGPVDGHPLEVLDLDPRWIGTDWQFRFELANQDRDLAALLDEFGYGHVRTWNRLGGIVDLDSAVRTNPAVSIRSATSDADMRTLYDVFALGFEKNWAEPRTAYDEWLADFRAAPGANCSGWFIAEIDSRAVGAAVVSDSRKDLGAAYFEYLAVLPGARRSGIADALMVGVLEFSTKGERNELRARTDACNEAINVFLARYGLDVFDQVDVFLKPVIDLEALFVA